MGERVRVDARAPRLASGWLPGSDSITVGGSSHGAAVTTAGELGGELAEREVL